MLLRLSFLLSAIVLLLGAVQNAGAQSLFEKLVTPGEVIQSHSKFESKCESCHEAFSKKKQRRLCLECHKEIGDDISRKRGFHGKNPEVTSSECKTCHTDHKGRKADIVLFDSETFNHALSDFELKGAHATTSCSSCHSQGKKFRDAPSTCFACHKGDDKHNGQLGQNCGSCHNETSWGAQRAFDHAKTRFPLKGAHERVQCAACHVGERYKDLPRECVSCHAVQDVHGGRYGRQCQSCHAPAQWKKVTFDHAKATKFPLRGAHARLQCQNCHRGDLYKDKLATACNACHATNDPHKGQLGKNCQTCHNETSWRQQVSFDHDLTKFPLIGLHAPVPCEECHRTEAYRGTPMACSECHKDTFHQSTLGTNCSSCHNPNGWALWRFDHDRDTKFALTGAHSGLKCRSCHTSPTATTVVAPRECAGCHRQDDAHRGAFGPQCDACHTTISFSQHRQKQ